MSLHTAGWLFLLLGVLCLGAAVAIGASAIVTVAKRADKRDEWLFGPRGPDREGER